MMGKAKRSKININTSNAIAKCQIENEYVLAARTRKNGLLDPVSMKLMQDALMNCGIEHMWEKTSNCAVVENRKSCYFVIKLRCQNSGSDEICNIS